MTEQTQEERDAFRNHDMVLDHFRITDVLRDMRDSISAKIDLTEGFSDNRYFTKIVNNIFVDANNWTCYSSSTAGMTPEEKEKFQKYHTDLLSKLQADIDLIVNLQSLHGDVVKKIEMFKMVLYKYQKQQRKRHRGIPYYMFTPGTTFIANYSHWSAEQKPKQYTVKELHQNGINSFVVVTEEKELNAISKEIDHITFNIDFIIKVLVRANGPVKVHEDEPYGEIFMSRPEPIVKGRYNTYQMTLLIAWVFKHLGIKEDPLEGINFDALGSFLINSRHWCKNPESYFWSFAIPKKKLRRTVRRIHNQFKLPIKQRLREEEDFHNHQKHDDLFNDDDEIQMDLTEIPVGDRPTGEVVLVYPDQY